MNERSGFGVIAGAVWFVGSAQWLVVNIIAESIYSGYSVGNQTISDLGTGSYGLVWNASTLLMGLSMIAGAYLGYRSLRERLVIIPMLALGTGSIIVSVFPAESSVEAIHGVGAFLAFISGGLAAVFSYRVTRGPFKYLSIILGISGLIALALYALDVYLGLGRGGMERMIVFPILIWLVGFSGNLMSVRATANLKFATRLGGRAEAEGESSLRK